MNCPSCKTENREGAKFCKRCGQALEAGQEAAPVPNAPSDNSVTKTVLADGVPAAQNPPPVSPPKDGGQGTVIAGNAPIAQNPSPGSIPSAGGGQKTVIASPDQNSGTDSIGTGGAVPPIDLGGGNVGGVVIKNKSSPAEGARPRRVLVGWLVTFTAYSNGQDFRLFEGRNMIGKDATEKCDIVLADTAVSSKHALILYRGGHYAIIDQDSTNGTWVNGEDIEIGGRSDLHDNDIIKLGDTTFVFKCFEKPEG